MSYSQKIGIPLENITKIIICYLGTLTFEDIYILNDNVLNRILFLVYLILMK